MPTTFSKNQARRYIRRLLAFVEQNRSDPIMRKPAPTASAKEIYLENMAECSMRF
jgi:hypothetical protein